MSKSISIIKVIKFQFYFVLAKICHAILGLSKFLLSDMHSMLFVIVN